MKYGKVVLLVVFSLSLAGNAFLTWRLGSLNSLLSETQSKLSQLQSLDRAVGVNPLDESKKIIEQVGRLIVLPQDEQPTVATVTDLEKLKGQDFFAQAQVGDKVLIYSKAGKVILYRPLDDKIIALAPLVIKSGDSATSTPNF